MLHSMTTPCPECPFRNDRPGYLTRDRAHEISESIFKGQSFPCHLTTTHEDDDDGEDHHLIDRDKETQCAGAEIFAAHQNSSSQAARIEERITGSVPALDMDAPVFTSAMDFADAQGPAPEPDTSDGSTGEPCSVANPACAAPCGYGYGGGAVDNDGASAEHWCPECGEAVCDPCSEEIDGEIICWNCAEEHRLAS